MFQRFRTTIFLAAGASCLVAAAPAVATDRFASPTGDDMGGTNPCTSAMTPCTIDRAVEVMAGAGDDVTLAPGTYALTDQLDFPNTDPQIVVHGAVGARPTIVAGTAAVPQGISADGVIRDVEIGESGSTGGYGLLQQPESANLAERVFVHATSDLNRTCEVSGTIRDSVCWAEGMTTIALRVGSGPGNHVTGTVVNVTAIASGTGSYGIQATSGGAGSSAAINATNVIAQGAFADVQAQASAPAVSNVTLDHSNYDTRQENPNATVTDPTTNDNEITPPVFVDAATGDFRQSPTSAGTIDQGTLSLSPFDLDGDMRSLGAAPDIGADEFVPAPPDSTPFQPGVTPVAAVAPPPTPPKKCKKKKKKQKPRAAAKKRKCRR